MPNRLIHEKSPYLLQHANNPVEWYPWSEEAFNKAKTEDKPIFLSIGYSTCYWCHVMEREVFENERIAGIMNSLFVNIKVDREERPDVDRIYMSALQSMTGSGGWPMSMFLTPELKPFYGATYVPPTSKYNLPGFDDLIVQIDEAWKSRREEVLNAGEKIVEHIKNLSKTGISEGELTLEPAEKFVHQSKMSFDDEYGGFGNAPKFPRPSAFNLLLRMYHSTKDDEILKMVVRTLTEMANGGIYDHLGGGFHRYSVDRFWRVPHFEKMLYDQAQLVISYLETYQLTNEAIFLEIAEDILKYVSEKLTHPDGGFYSAEDAESALIHDDLHKKEEGAFYVWEKSEVDNILAENATVYNYVFGILEKGNTPAGSDPHNVFVNKNILYRAQPSLDKSSFELNKPVEEIKDILKTSKELLYAVRENRPKPHLDDKILTSWNGLMISAYSFAYKITGKDEYLDRAKRAADFMLARSFALNETLYHRWRDGEAKVEGNLDDYAFLSQSLMDLYEASFEKEYLLKAAELNDKMINIFYDEQDHGFFDISENDKSILYRSKDDYDSAEPAGNSVAIMNLIRLSEFLHDEKLSERAKMSLQTFADKMNEIPYSMPQMICALHYFLSSRMQVVVSGSKDDEDTSEMMKLIHKKYLPSKVLVYVDPEEELNNSRLSSWLPYKSDKPSVYICENFTCLNPLHTTDELKIFLE